MPHAGTYLFGASLLYKVNSSTSARMRGRLILNGTTELHGSFGEVSRCHKSLATALWQQTMVLLTAGDTVELQGYFRAADGYFAANHTSFCGERFPVCPAIFVASKDVSQNLAESHQWKLRRQRMQSARLASVEFPDGGPRVFHL